VLFILRLLFRNMLAYLAIVNIYSVLPNYLAEPVMYMEIDTVLHAVFM
jgi:hypothetical protein